MKSTSRPEKLSTRQTRNSASTSRIISSRSSTLNSGLLASFWSTATTTSSNSGTQRSMMSRWPSWMGSNEPG